MPDFVRFDPSRIEVVDDRVVSVLRAKTPAERLHIALNIWDSARRILISHLGNTHPDWSRRDVEREVARRLLHGAV